jgi:hypothetical protein
MITSVYSRYRARAMSDGEPGCPNGGRNKCSACKSVEYCSRACQKLHWAAHKAACKVTSPGNKT